MLIPTVVGMLGLLLTLGAIGVGLALWLVGRWRKIGSVRRGGGWLAVVAASLYGLAWIAGVPLVSERRLGIGREVSFCGVDCHLHVSVAAVEPGKSLGVTVAFRSNAKAVDEFPGDLRFYLVDRAGHRLPPTSGFVAEVLAPGARLEKRFEFSLPDPGQAKGLVVYRPGWIDYLLPGVGNPLVQQRFVLALN